METKETFKAIDPITFDNLLEEYTSILPDKVSTLDRERYDTIPENLKQRKEADASLTKDEVATLVNWKLSHGKFRPSLKGLVQQNVDIMVKDQTRDAFKAFFGKSVDDAKQAINTLTKLRGIGPATASLLLSVYDAENAPFFSDELFRWCFYEDGRGRGWDRDIKYNTKEYIQLFDRVQELKKRFQNEFDKDVAAVDIERVAYVLGKRPAGSAPAGSSTGRKRKAETEPDQISIVDTTAADARMVEQVVKQDEHLGIKKAKPKTKSESQKAKASLESATNETTASSRPRRKR